MSDFELSLGLVPSAASWKNLVLEIIEKDCELDQSEGMIFLENIPGGN